MIDWTDAFDNSGYVPGARDLPALWAQKAQEFRDAHTVIEHPYGPGPREVYDLFPGPQGLCVFLHGGYWHLFDKSYWSHLAASWLKLGWSVAIPSYPLAPEARISEITQAVARAITAAAERVDGPIYLLGHSAGGHLATRMVAEPSPLPAAVRDRLMAVASISGVHDLRPLTLAQMNATLRLDEAETAAHSPALLPPTADCPVDLYVGTLERPEFLRQTRLLDENWRAGGASVRGYYCVGQNHFTVVDHVMTTTAIAPRA